MPNVRATVQELYDGLRASAQNAWPSLKADVGEVNQALSPFFPAGFYYKTFKWPPKAWDKVYEPFIRRAAGLGEAPEQADPDRYTNRFAHCDVLVAGGGAAGLAAALAAGRAGKSVMLVDENPEFGGWLLSDLDAKVGERSGTAWVAETVAELRAMSNVRLLPRTTVFGYFQQNMIGLAERVTEHLSAPSPRLPRERMWQVRAGEVVIAQGAVERHMVFPGNDRPGVMLAGAARTYLNRYGVAVGSKVALYTATDEAYAAAFDLHDAGVEVAAIVDHRADPGAEALAGAANRNIEVIRRRVYCGHSRTACASATPSPGPSPRATTRTIAASTAMRCSCPPAGRPRCTYPRKRARSLHGTRRRAASCRAIRCKRTSPWARATARTN